MKTKAMHVVVKSQSKHCDIHAGMIGTARLDGTADAREGMEVEVTGSFGQITSGGFKLEKQTRTVWLRLGVDAEHITLTNIYQPAKRLGDILYFTIGMTASGKERFVTRTISEYETELAKTHGPGNIVETGARLWWKPKAKG